MVAVEKHVHLSHLLLIRNIISAQIEASNYVVMQGCPPKTCEHLEHQICQRVILEIPSRSILPVMKARNHVIGWESKIDPIDPKCSTLWDLV